MKRTNIYVTEDGKEFDNRRDALAHEKYLSICQQIRDQLFKLGLTIKEIDIIMDGLFVPKDRFDKFMLMCSGKSIPEVTIPGGI